jgi:hypothetical protein
MNPWTSFIAAGCLILLLAGCGPDSAPAPFTAEQKEMVKAASRAVAQYEDWADVAEYKIEKHAVGWCVTAWRVAHPEAKGNARYVPWGYRVILVDRGGKVVEYKNSK